MLYYRRGCSLYVLDFIPLVFPNQFLDLSDILPTAYHSVVDTRVEEGDIVGIWGYVRPLAWCYKY